MEQGAEEVIGATSAEQLPFELDAARRVWPRALSPPALKSALPCSLSSPAWMRHEAGSALASDVVISDGVAIAPVSSAAIAAASSR